MQLIPTYSRRPTSATRVGSVCIGSDYPICIQTMANTSTNDVEASVAQAERCAAAGAQLLRFTTQGAKEVENLKLIHERLQGLVPLVADIHFRSDVADMAAQVVEKVRINPGNYANDPSLIRERFLHLIDICRAHGTALRIGVNHGSLSPRIMEQYGDTPEGMIASCMEFLRIAREADFHDIVLSIKASDTRIMVTTVRELVRTMDAEDMHYPLHLGVTEAGEGEDGRIKSAVGIGALLADGIGDTIRVSLSEAPENEVPVAQALVDYFANTDSPRYDGSVVVEVLDNIGDKAEVRYSSFENDWGTFALQAAAECGRLLWDYEAGMLTLVNPHFPADELQTLSKDILQAAGICRYRTEFVSCPGCGRTMFDLQGTVARIKQAFAEHSSPRLQQLKIAVMGCIVNGPGEMADADYGYVGAGRDRISLYRGKECVMKNVPQEEAVDLLLKLIDNK